MKKMKKLLSVVLAVIMALSCMSVLASAHQAYEEPGEYYYDSNDNPRAYLFTDEQRASALCDTVNELLASMNIYIEQSILIDTIVLDLRSLDALFDSFDDLSGYLTYLGGLLGDLGDLEFDVLMNADISVYNEGGAQTVLLTLLEFIEANGEELATIVKNGELDLGLIGNFVDISAVGDILGDLPGLLGGIIYGIGTRQLTNGIGDDPAYPNSVAWDDLETKPNFDDMVYNLLKKLLTEPNNTIRITKASQNTLGEQALTEEVDGVTYYYCYGLNNDGTLKTEGTAEEKQYLTHWDENSALLKGVSADKFLAALDLDSKSLYTLLEDMLAWAYDSYGGHNLDGQLRATLMQFCGAVNVAVTDETIQSQLKAIMNTYNEKEDDARGNKQVLRDEFKNTKGIAGNYNFMYIALTDDGKVDTTADFNAKPDNLYYVVQWDQNYQYYHVTYPEESEFFAEIDWEYQAPMWSEIMTTVGWKTGNSILAHINDIVGTILDTALINMNAENGGFTWTAGETAGLGVTNVTNLVKYIIKTDTVKLFGSEFTIPSDFDSYDLEDALVMIAGIILDGLMPALVLPDDVASLEEIIVYALREYMAEILPDTGAEWDEAIAAAESEDDFLDIALSMGVSTGIYYLNNLIGVGTTTNGGSNTTVGTTTISNFNDSLGTTYTWQVKLDWLVDWIITTYVPDLVANSGYSQSDESALTSLSKILSKLFPTLASVLNCSSDSYALDLNKVYNVLRAILNGDFTGLANALIRNKAETAAGNLTAMNAIANVITDLFGGLGFETYTASWSNLKSLFTTAGASTTPLTTLIGTYGDNTAISNLINYLLPCLGGTRTTWLYDVLTIITMLRGWESALSYNMTVSGIEPAYAGSETATVDYNFKLDVSGVKSYFNTARYKSGTGIMDGTYSATVIDATVYDADGNTVASKKIGASLAANQSVDISFVGIEAPETPKIYTIVTRYRVKLPSQSSDENNEVMEHKASFVITAQTNDSIVTTATKLASYSDSDKYSVLGSTRRAFEWTNTVYSEHTNVYISEQEPLSKINSNMLYFSSEGTESLTTARFVHSKSWAYVNGYGYNKSNTDGTITVHDSYTAASGDTAESWGTQITDHSSVIAVTKDGESSQITNGWFYWNFNGTTLASSSGGLDEAQGADYDQTGVTATHSWTRDNNRASAQMWIADSTSRSAIEGDFVVYTATPTFTFGYDTGSCGWTSTSTGESGTAAATATFTQYINVYNSYDLENILNERMGLSKEDYDTDSDAGAAAWAEYEGAISYALDQLYGEWVGSTFKKDHTITVAEDFAEKHDYETTSVSSFQYAGDRLKDAVTALDDYKADNAEATATLIAPSNSASPYNRVYNLLTAQQEKGLKNQDWVLYRWYEYWDDYNAINTAITALTPPAEKANNTVVGLEATGDELDNAIATITDSDVKGIVEGLKQAPSAEAQQAVTDAYNAYVEGYDAVVALYAVDALELQAQNMVLDGTDYTASYDASVGRLLPKYSTYESESGKHTIVNEYYYLEKAINDYGSEEEADYSAESYALYSAALAEAKNVLAAAKENNSTQSAIHMARYEFLKAYKALIDAGKEVDVSALEVTYATAQDILDKMNTADAYAVVDGVDATEAYKTLLLAMGYPVTYTMNGADEATTYYVGGEYTAAYALSQKGLVTEVKKGNWVGEIDANLEAAIANFELAAVAAPELGAIDGTSGVIGETTEVDGVVTGYIYGVAAGDDANDYFALVDETAGTVEWTASAAGATNGTGAVATVKDNAGNTVAVYTLVVFGDVNGDAAVTATDSATVDNAALGGTIDGEANNFAANVNGDESGVTATDAATVANAALGGTITVNPYAA